MNIPSSVQEIYIKLANDMKAQLEKSNPFLNKSFTKAELTAFAGRIYDVYKQLQDLINQCFDDTRRGEYLTREASDYGLTLNSATSSTGFISATGSGIIPLNTELSINGLTYIVQEEVEITTKSESVDIDYTESVATVVFEEAHFLGNGQEITISGATPSELNGTFEISVVDSLTIQYDVSVGYSGSANGTCEYDNAVLAVVSDGEGTIYNREQGEELTFDETIIGVDAQAVVCAEGITGGTDEEDAESLRERLQFRKKNPAAYFNASQVESILRQNELVDKVYIEPRTPQVGEATIYFMKKDFEIPSTSDLNAVKDYFEPYLPITDDYTNIHLLAPTGQDVSFIFSSITEDTTSMREAIETNLIAWFEDNSEPNRTIVSDEYRSVIINTIDPKSLARLTSFTLTSPTGDLAPSGTGYILRVGDVNFL